MHLTAVASLWARDNTDSTVVQAMRAAPERDEDEMLNELSRFETSARCTTASLLASVRDLIRRLFKISALIAKATTRDRHAVAETKVDCSIYRQYDAAHVRAKFTKAGMPDWIIERMTNATLKRRQFVMYTDQHDQRLQDYHDKMSISGLAQSLVADTKASTLGKLDLSAPEEAFDDLQSMATATTSANNGDTFTGISVPPIREYAELGEHFSCPVCHTTQRFNGQQAWK